MTTFSLKNTLLSFVFIALCSNVFAQSNTDADNRMKIRLGFTSVNNLHRQILVTVDRDATAGIDFGYDAENFENHIDDMYWMIDDTKFTIQGIDIIHENSVLPLGLHTGADGVNTILIDALENVPQELEIVIFDTETNTYHDIKGNSGFSIDLPAGTYLDRFELRFADRTEETTTTEEETAEEDGLEEEPIKDDIITNGNEIKVRYINNTQSIAINKTGMQTIQSVAVYNFSGQLKAQFYNVNNNEKKTTIQTSNLRPGHYIIIVNTNLGSTSKKVLVN